MMNLTHTESAVKKGRAFYPLKQMAHPVYQNNFKAFVTPRENGTYAFSVSIEDTMNIDESFSSKMT
ncbi:hypothetical protein GWK90_08385 [Candidatus Hamiltonella defensa]|uniref:Uncharacterized protein n=1 Tax=Candidatus Williamhamiltonella defendens TaxID=138072 RepID=A0AAC9VJ75_9ENTR|nr:hypothetical protein [Candidatus Hamiltonella defensa]ASV33306.1 hypothetical protein CJJ18_03625 [Candidatus Hamiltonella defensa]AWK16271.1 hypothetical protein CCS40_03635 [Candidatus Hamiltonella defensa]MBK4362209.1 hypothetical protein [Candidatus Hamiltonella defensa]